jgi:hypothetical protein
MYELSVLYASGQGVVRNARLAAELLEDAVGKKDERARTRRTP